MSIKNIINLCLGIIFVGFLLLQLYRQKKRGDIFFTTSYKGRVISTVKGNKGYFNIQFLVADKKRELSIYYKDSSLRLFSGDSIYKPPSSENIFVKKYEDTVFRKLHVNVLP